MKKLFFAFSFLLFAGFSDGGGDEKTNFFLYYEPSLNLLYVSVETELTVQVNKKPYTLQVTNNIAVYGIDKDSVNYVFKSGMEEQIREVIFEESFSSENHSVRLNVYRDDEEYYSQFCINNSGIVSRELSPHLIIETVSLTSGNSTLWLCHKNGKNLRKIAELGEHEDYFLDVKGRNILLITKQNGQVSAKKIPY